MLDEMGVEALGLSLSVQAMGGFRFGPDDIDRLKRDVYIVVKAATQDVGWARADANRNRVTASEMDGATMRIVCLACCMVLSGKADEIREALNG